MSQPKPFTMEDIERLYKPSTGIPYVPPVYYVNQSEYDAFTEKWPHMAPYLKVIPKMTITKTVRLSNGACYVTAEMQEKYGTHFFKQINDFSIPEFPATVKP